jgi:hypothetical protein
MKLSPPRSTLLAKPTRSNRSSRAREKTSQVRWRIALLPPTGLLVKRARRSSTSRLGRHDTTPELRLPPSVGGPRGLTSPTGREAVTANRTETRRKHERARLGGPSRRRP